MLILGNIVNVSGFSIEVLPFNTENLLEEVHSYFADYRKEVENYPEVEVFPIYDSEGKTEGNLEAFDKEENEIKLLMDSISENIEVLIPYTDKITVKKNKRFRKGSVSKLFVIESASSYFTDYTNAWATKELVIRAISEDAVVLDFRRVVLTY